MTQNRHELFFRYGEDILSTGIALNIAKGKLQGIVSPETRAKMLKNRQVVENIVHNHKTVYGINTGFGPFCSL